MPTSGSYLRSELERFLQVLEFQLDDSLLAGRHAHPIMYWDTAHVRHAVLGMAAFYNVHSEFQRDIFNDQGSLVVSLAAAGWLGPMHMLQPHQAEFLNLVSLEFELYGRMDPPGGMEQFFRDTELPNDDMKD